MALTVTKAAASQHSLKYTYAGAGSFTTTVSAAQMISDCAAGPLKDLLNRVNTGITSVTWANLLTSKAISLYVVAQGTSGVSASAAVPLVVFSIAPPNSLSVFISSGADTVNGMIEIRYHPSQVR